MKKIGLIGAAGLGRSTFGKEIAKKEEIIFLPSKDITRPLLKKYGWKYRENSCVEKFLARKDIEFELVSERIYQESLLVGGFVTDRTTLECFAYALLRSEEYSDNDLSLLEKMCKENMKKYTHLFYFPYHCGWFEENGVRTSSVYFQWQIDMMIRGLLKDWGIVYSPIPDSVDIMDFISDQLKQSFIISLD